MRVAVPFNSSNVVKSQAVSCPNCSAQVGADDINIKALVGKCAACSHIFPLPVGQQDADAVQDDELEPSCPSGIRLEYGPAGELYIRRRWFFPGLFFLLFFCIAWDAFLFFWYSMALFGPMNGDDGFQWIAVIFPVCHVAVGVGLTYYVLAGFLNTTKILVDQDTLYIRHRPIPWIGNRDLATPEIQGFELDYCYSQGNNDAAGEPHYSLSAHHIDSRQIVLLSGLKRNQARYIGYQLARHLDVPLSRDEVERRPNPRWLRWLRRD